MLHASLERDLVNSIERRKTHWIPFILGLAAVIFFVWLASMYDTTHEVSTSAPDSKQSETLTARARQDVVPTLSVAPGKRLRLNLADLPRDEPVAIALGLSGEARGPAHHGVRLVSTRGTRIELEATPLPGADSGLRLEIDRDLLAPGLYMIVLDTFEDHPLRLRRYALEIK